MCDRCGTKNADTVEIIELNGDRKTEQLCDDCFIYVSVNV